MGQFLFIRRETFKIKRQREGDKEKEKKREWVQNEVAKA